MSDTYFGLLSYVKSVDAPFAIGAIDAGMAAAGFALRQTSEGESVREYSNADGWRLKCITSLASGPSSFHDADHDRLGITPRRIMTKWDEGKEIEIRWY